MNKKCIFILPYFGKFNNYFQLFLNSFSYNSNYDLLIITDCVDKYNYPANVRLVNSKLAEVKATAEKKLGFEVCLDKPYKLCDFKPAYGLLFEEYIGGYEYWGHCDCDILFGNLENLLTPLLEQGYDKLFAAGHMTIYKNTYENNRRFMSLHNGRVIYKEAFTTSEIYVFDEDCQSKHHNDNNVHSIFLESGINIFSEDLSMNTAANSAKFSQAKYIPEERKFINQPYIKARYYFHKGDIFSLYAQDSNLKRRDYLYLHFQMRKMRVDKKITMDHPIEILPDRFRFCRKIPSNMKELHTGSIGFPYLFWIDVIIKKIKRKMKLK